jgi:hypothetical protein
VLRQGPKNHYADARDAVSQLWRIQFFWVHLAAAKMIASPVTELPIADANYSSQMDQYFVKSPSGIGYLIAFTWNNITYIKTGIVGTDNSGNPWVQTGAVSGQQMQYITQKLGQNTTEMVKPGCDNQQNCDAPPPPVVYKGPAIPVGRETPTGPGGDYIYLEPTYYYLPAGTSCMIPIAGGYTFNLGAKENCNLMWKLNGM